MFNEYINNDSKWIEFLNSRLETNYESKKNKQILKDYIENKKYKEITKQLENNTYTFSNLKKKVLNILYLKS